MASFVGDEPGNLENRRADRIAANFGVTFRELVLFPYPFDRLPPPFGAYKFPEEMSFKTCFSSDRSATKRRSRAFSFSSSFIRRA